MIYSKTCEYALRALKYLASKEGGSPTGLEEIKVHTGVPRDYLAKIFQCLAGDGIIDSKSGPRGGYSLSVDPSKLTVFQVMAALDNVASSPLSNCVMGHAECSSKIPCSLHGIWEKARKKMEEALRKETVADLLKEKKEGYINHGRHGRLSQRMRRIAGRRS